MPLRISEGTVEFYGPEADDPDSGNGHVVTYGTKSQRRAYSRGDASTRYNCPDAQVERVDFIKIDVEGFEWPVLQGASKQSQNFVRILSSNTTQNTPRAAVEILALSSNFFGLIAIDYLPLGEPGLRLWSWRIGQTALIFGLLPWANVLPTADPCEMNEMGKHVRAQYTKEDYCALREPVGLPREPVGLQTQKVIGNRFRD